MDMFNVSDASDVTIEHWILIIDHWTWKWLYFVIFFYIKLFSTSIAIPKFRLTAFISFRRKKKNKKLYLQCNIIGNRIHSNWLHDVIDWLIQCQHCSKLVIASKASFNSIFQNWTEKKVSHRLSEFFINWDWVDFETHGWKKMAFFVFFLFFFEKICKNATDASNNPKKTVNIQCSLHVKLKYDKNLSNFMHFIQMKYF